MLVENRTREGVVRSARLFKAMADPTRLRLLNLLLHGERCVCELIDIVGGPQPRISRHLAYLKRAGLVLGRREGQWVHYRLSPTADALHGKLIDCVRCCLSELPPLERDVRRLRSRYGCCDAPRVDARARRVACRSK